ncbi:MAG TPA: hypothetical protein DCX95_02280 [Elusimicrobia bacterium]|nr:hypothetical protein [Elusimicrobiota bacterium]
MEIRIYYECLEQGYNYIKPIIDEILLNRDIPVKLIKRSRKPEQLPKGVLFAIQSLTTPDILITAINENKEHPLVLIEFTEAVTTEDHELQRTYGAVASYLSDMYYIKVSGYKKSEKIFGGAEYNPYSTPKILIDNFNYEGFIIADWKTEDENIYNLSRSSNLLGCPPLIPILKDTIQLAVKSFIDSSENWFKNSIVLLKKRNTYLIFREKVDKATGTEVLLKTWKEREERNENRNNLRYFVDKKWIGAKINRFSHAMDPDRGILTFISFVWSNSYEIFGIYALVRQRGEDILKSELKNLKQLKTKLKAAIEKDGGGIPKWFADELKKVVLSAKTLNAEINFQPVWEKYKNKISENKVVMTIAYFLDGMYLNHNGIKLYWDRYKLLGKSKSDFIPLMKSYFGFNNYVSAISTEKIEMEVDEDEVTYAIVHRVLIPNKFRIVSISYPGSQGGGAILPDPDLGKAQPREYPDIIALPPEKDKNIDVILNESKGMFNQASVEKDMGKILRYKTDKKLQKALKETLIVAKVIDQNDNVYKILIGVAFGVTNNTSTTWKPDKVDFIFRIVNRENWAIGIFNQSLRELIPTISGKTNFPEVYKIVDEHSQQNLF